ncbi:hypothetical protein WL552_12660, partial [Staphylococcus epidermidis]
TQNNSNQNNQQAQQPQQQTAQNQQANTQQNNGALNQEQMEANAKVAKQNGYTGIPNGDVGGVPSSNKPLSEQEIQSEIDKKANTE